MFHIQKRQLLLSSLFKKTSIMSLNCVKYQPSSCETIIMFIFDGEDLLFIYSRITSGKIVQNICSMNEAEPSSVYMC